MFVGFYWVLQKLTGENKYYAFYYKGEDSTTVMFAGNTTETNSTLENMLELFMKGDSSTVMFG